MSIHFTSECWHWMPDSEIVLKRDFGIVVNLYKKNYTRGVEMLQFHPSLRLMLSNLFFQGENIAPHISAIHRTLKL